MAMRMMLLALALALAAWLTLGRITPPGAPPATTSPEAVPWSAPFCGRLVDERTGEPLPDLRLTIEERVLFTDAQGRFRGALPLPEGRVRIELGDARLGTWFMALEHHPDLYQDGLPDRPVPVGPTFSLVSEESLEGRRVHLISLSDPALPSATAMVRPGARHAWARFRPLPSRLERAGPWRLVVEDRERVIEGPAAGVVGASHLPVLLQLIDRADLLLRVTDGAGGVPVGAVVHLQALAAPGPNPPTLRQAVSAGQAELRDLRPGSYRVTLQCAGYYGLDFELLLAPQTFTDLPLVLEPVLGEGRIEVVLESASGEYRGETDIVITPVELDDAGIDWGTRSARVEWRERGQGWIGTCAFEHLPPGEYELSPRGGRFHCWLPSRLRAHADGDPVALRLLDRGDESDLMLRVFDRKTGAWIDEYSLELTGEGCGTSFTFGRAVSQVRAARVEPTLSGVPPAVEVRWCISAQGYQVHCGDLDAFSPVERVDGRWVRVADVHLVRGD